MSRRPPLSRSKAKARAGTKAGAGAEAGRGAEAGGRGGSGERGSGSGEGSGHSGGRSGLGPYLEGGDVLVLGSHVFVGRSGLASDDAGFHWLRKYLGPHGFTVEQVPLQPHVLHLDCALGLVREGLLLVYEERLTEGLPPSLRDWDRIAVTEEAAGLGVNGLPISSDVYITDPEFARLGGEIERHGVRVEYVDFAISRTFGGSFRCSTQPLSRAD